MKRRAASGLVWIKAVQKSAMLSSLISAASKLGLKDFRRASRCTMSLASASTATGARAFRFVAKSVAVRENISASNETCSLFIDLVSPDAKNAVAYRLVKGVGYFGVVTSNAAVGADPVLGREKGLASGGQRPQRAPVGVPSGHPSRG